MNTSFKDIMSKQTDEDLIKIVTVNRNGYEDLAVKAAEDEMKNRNIDNKKFEQIKDELVIKFEKQKEFDSTKVIPSIRFIHFVVDSIIIFILTITVIILIDTYTYINPKEDFLIVSSVLIPILSIYIGYYLVLETKYQKTIGKFITKTHVINKDGTKPNGNEILKRTFCRFIPFDRISFLFSKNGFHDRFSKTTVVKDINNYKNS